MLNTDTFRDGWSRQVRAEREAELGQRLSWSHGDWGAYVGPSGWGLVARFLSSYWDPPVYTAQGTSDSEQEADGCRLSADCIPQGWSYKPFLGGPGQDTSKPASLVCRRTTVGPALCWVTLK